MTISITDGSGVLIPDIPSVSITVSSSGSGFLTTSSSTSQATAQFSGLKFTTKGSMDIQMITDTTTLINSGTITATVTSTLSSITSVYSTTSASTNFDFTVAVSLKDLNGNAYTDTSSIAVTCSNDAASFVVSLVSAGLYKLLFTTPGSKTVVVTATSNGAVVTTTDTISIAQSKLKFDSINLASPSTSSTTFGLVVGIYDLTLTSKETFNGAYSITISIVPVIDVINSGTSMSGTLTAPALSGVATFSNLRILSSGTFTIKATCSGFADLLSDSTYVIISVMKSYLLTTSKFQGTVFEEIELGLLLKGADDATYKSPATFKFMPISSNTYGFSTPIQSSNGIFSTKFYSSIIQSFVIQGEFTSGTNILQISAIYLDITAAKLDVAFDAIPMNQRSIFSMTLAVQNSLKQTITTFPSFTVTIQLIDGLGPIYDTYATNMIITGGSATVSNKQITVFGTFYISTTLNTPLITSYTSSPITIIQAPSSITAIASVTSISTYFYFTITITLYTTDTQVMTSSIPIKISDETSSLQGDAIIQYEGSTVLSNYYFTSPGNKNIKVIPNNSEPHIAVIIPILVVKSLLVIKFTTSIVGLMVGTSFTFSIEIRDPIVETVCALTISGISTALTSSDLTITTLAEFGENNLYVTSPLSTFTRSINTSGIYKITASGPALESGSTSEFKVSEDLFSINLESNIASPTIDDYVQIKLTLSSFSGRPYNLEADVILYSMQSNYITGLGTRTSSTGVLVFEIKFTASKTYTLQAVCSWLSKSLTLIVSDPPRLIMSLSPTPLVSATVFSINIQAKILNAVSGVPITLKFICQENAVCSGSKLNKEVNTINTVDGFVQYSNMQIYSSGSFYLSATSPGYKTAQIILNDVKNDVKDFITTHTSSPTVNFKTSIPLNMIGLDDVPFNLPVTITLSEAENNDFGGDKIISVTQSSFTLIIQFLLPVAYDIIFSVSNSLIVHHLKFDVKPMLVKFLDPPSLRYGLGLPIPISIAVYDYTGVTLETQGQYSFEITLYPPQTLTPNILKVSSGKGSISSLIGFPGLYSFSLPPNIKYTIIPGSSILVYDTVSKLMYNPQDLTQKSNQLFLFNITLFNSNGKLFNYANSIDFICSDNSGNLIDAPLSTTNASASLLMYFVSEGTKACTIKFLNGTSIDVTFKVMTADINLDEKCAAIISSDLCGKCVPQAELTDGKCSCVQYSRFNSITKTCECDIGLIANNGMCSKCGNYFKNYELSGYYSKSFKSIIIEFFRPVNQLLVVGCSDFISLPDKLSPYLYDCSWNSANALEIQFNRVIPITDSKIKLNPRYVQAVGTACLFNIVSLSVSVNVIYQKPIPIAKIEGMSKISLNCATEGITIESKFKTSDYLYQWRVQQSSSQSLVDYVSNQQLPTLVMPSELLEAGTMKISLTVTSSLYQTSASDSFTINILETEALSIRITAGSTLIVSPLDITTLKASVYSDCESSGPYSFIWSYSASPSDSKFDFATMTNKDKNLITLSIQAYSMHKGKTYTFKVDAFKGNLSGSASIIVNIQSKDLVVSIGRSCGTVGTQTDLYIPANVIDPDNECTKADIIWFWTCIQGGNQCLDSNGNNLILFTQSINLIIKKSYLMDGAFYQFTLSASCKYKDYSVSASIDIQIDSERNGDIQINAIYKIESTEDVIVIPKLVSIENPKFFWAVIPKVSGLNLHESALYIPPNILNPGITYRATLTMYSKSIEDGISAYTDVVVKCIPSCKGLVLNALDGGKFNFNVIDCENDDPTNIISYSFGYTNEEYIVWVTRFIYQNSISLLIEDNKGKGVAKVCYFYKDCTIFTANFPRTFRSLKLDQASFEDSYDPDLLVSLLIYYSPQIVINADFEYLYGQYLKFFSNISVDQQVFDIFLDSTIAIFRNSYALTRNNKEELATSDNILINFLMNYSSLITEIQIKKILKILEFDMNLRDSITAIKVLELISKINYRSKPLGYELFANSAKISFYRYRNLAFEYVNKTFICEKDIISISDVPLDNEGIFDIFYAKYLQSDTIFDISFYRTGSYSSYNYNLSSVEALVSLNLNDSIKYTVSKGFNNKKIHRCVYFRENQWVSGGCNIISINKTHAALTIDHLSSFKIVVDDNCKLGLGPILTMSLSLVCFLLLGLVFYLHDKKHPAISNDNRLLVYYPLTSLFINQSNSRRSIVVFQLLSSYLLILTLIGAFHYQFDSPEKDSENGFKNYYGKQLSRGAAGWALAQVFIFLIFCLNALVKICKNMLFIAIALMVMAVSSCIIGVSIMVAKYCGGWSEYWIINFLIFLGIDLVFKETLYALLLFKIVGRRLKNQTVPIDSDHTRNLHINSRENQGFTSTRRPCTSSNENQVVEDLDIIEEKE